MYSEQGHIKKLNSKAKSVKTFSHDVNSKGRVQNIEFSCKIQVLKLKI